MKAIIGTPRKQPQRVPTGCSQGLLDALNGHGSLVILDFGGQLGDGDGTRALTDTFNFTNSDIESIAIEFAVGYFVCTAGDLETTLDLAIGTNNAYEDVDKAGGEAWAKLVNRVDETIDETPEEALQVVAAGADDLEDGYSDGEAANQWATGYNEQAEWWMDDFGDAGGCPADSHDNGACTGGYGGWDQNLEYLLAYGDAVDDATPEIYYNPPPGSPVNAEQWAEIAVYAHDTLAGCMSFIGPLDQGGAEESNTATQAWNQLNRVVEEKYTTLFEHEGPEFCGAGELPFEYSLEI